MIGEKYWATGIELRSYRRSDGRVGWGAIVDFVDDGFRNDDADAGHVSTEGRLRTRYYVADGEDVTGLTAAIDAAMRDAARLGIEWRHEVGATAPSLCVVGHDEDPDARLPDGWRQMVADQAARIGWRSPYAGGAAPGHRDCAPESTEI